MASLFSIEPCFPADTNWDEVILEAKSQGVLTLISPVIPVHVDSVDQCKAYYMRMLYEQDKLIKLLNSNNIPCVILKGCAAAKYYPKPYLRTMGDIDILVPFDDIDKAEHILENNGYKYDHGKDETGRRIEGERNVTYLRNGFIFELHYRFSSQGYDIDSILKEAMDQIETIELNGYIIPVYPDDINGLILLGHINQHLKDDNLGIRQIIDWEMYVHSVADKEWIVRFSSLADKVGLLPLATYVTKLCNLYFGLPESFEMFDEVNESLVEELLEVLLTNGNFGRKKADVATKEEQKMESASYELKKYGFFGYFTHIGLETNDFLKKHPSHKVLAFTYGFFRLTGKGIKALFSNRSSYSQMREGKKRYELYKKLGVKS